MTIVFFILVVIVCVVLGLIVLIQNPKGGGLSGTLAGFNNQFMGVKQTTDVLEKGTWIFASALVVLCIVSTLFISDGVSSSGTDTSKLKDLNTSSVPTTTAPATNSGQPNSGTLQLDTNKK